MKKIALLIALLMVVGIGTAWCISATVDKMIDEKSKSDIRPVEDSAKLLGMVNKGADESYKAMTKPLNPVLDPVRKVRDGAIDASKKVVNTTWDALTYFSPHRKKDKSAE